MPKLRYIGPHDEVELPDGRIVKRNHQVEVTDDLAGHAPSARLVPAMEELHQAIVDHDHPGAVKLRDEITELNDGSGLLAQFDNWEKVAAAPKKGAAKKANAKKAAPVEPVVNEPVVSSPIEDEVNP